MGLTANKFGAQKPNPISLESDQLALERIQLPNLNASINKL